MAKADYIIKTRNALYNLQEFESSFSLEAKVIEHCKCILMQNIDLEDFYTDGVYVSVHESKDGYTLYYDKYVMELTVYEKQIIDYTVSS
ncbi:MAG: hypothetical protein Q4D13_01955 [Erysipelotrichaceae bacterium]|nr:hypothetical protein [Erysipelotrichaceae bacterium]